MATTEISASEPSIVVRRLRAKLDETLRHKSGVWFGAQEFFAIRNQPNNTLDLSRRA